MAIRLAAPVALALMLTGCGSIGAIGIPGVSRGDPRPPPVTAAPQPPVQTSALPPPGQVGQQQTIQSGGAQDPFLPQRTTPPASGGFVQQPPAQPSGTLQPLPQQQASGGSQQQVAATQPASSGIGRTDLLGGWTISSAGDSCQLFMTLTSWRGGYRASTRGCSNDTLKGISAWDLKGSQVILSGQAGTPVATLLSSGGNRFNGTTSGDGGAVTFFR